MKIYEVVELQLHEFSVYIDTLFTYNRWVGVPSSNGPLTEHFIIFVTYLFKQC